VIVPLFKPWITKADKTSILTALNNSQLTDGPILRKFESKFAKYVGTKFAIGVSNGTAALHLALHSLNIQKNDEVLVPNITFPATINSVLLCQAKPVLVDIDESLNISIDSLEKKISLKTKAIMPVHLAGLACNMKKIVSIARKHNLLLIEDCAQALGTKFSKKHVGTFGNAGCFSFYPTKNITSIEGGMVVTNSNSLAKKLLQIRNHGITTNLKKRYSSSKPWDYEIEQVGYNYRLDEIRSALAISQLKRINVINSKRISAAKYYNNKLKNIPGLEILNLQNFSSHVYHLYIIRITKDFGLTRDKLHQELKKKGISTTVHYKPLHNFSYFRHPTKSNFPISEKAYQECLTIPLFPTISRKEQNYVIQKILELSKNN